ncbi:MAG: flavodoxin family protein [Candidatus Heteroscillospira sp.]
MSKNVLVISTSLREHSNSEALADAFLAGAGAAGHQTEKLSLRGKSLAFCRGCLACQKLGKCTIQDDAVEIAEKMRLADVIAFATPIYYYEMSGQMKTLLDRANSLYSSDYSFRDIYLLTTAAEDGADVPVRAESGLQGWIDCFDRARLAGSVFAGGVDAAVEAAGHPALLKARELGAGI